MATLLSIFLTPLHWPLVAAYKFQVQRLRSTHSEVGGILPSSSAHLNPNLNESDPKQAANKARHTTRLALFLARNNTHLHTRSCASMALRSCVPTLMNASRTDFLKPFAWRKLLELCLLPQRDASGAVCNKRNLQPKMASLTTPRRIYCRPTRYLLHQKCSYGCLIPGDPRNYRHASTTLPHANACPVVRGNRIHSRQPTIPSPTLGGDPSILSSFVCVFFFAKVRIAFASRLRACLPPATPCAIKQFLRSMLLT